jgi:hypothetical protein
MISGLAALGRLMQCPLIIVEVHASRNINHRVWLSADGYYIGGGERASTHIRATSPMLYGLGAGMGTCLRPGGDIELNAESIVAKPRWVE